MPWTNIEMADEVIKFFKPHSSVNLGIGMPTVIAERIPAELNIMIHSEKRLSPQDQELASLTAHLVLE